MKFTIEQPALSAVLDHLRSVVEKRNTIPILSNILVTASLDRLTLVATDLDIELTETVDCFVVDPGKVTVPAHLLHDIARKAKKGAVVMIETNDAHGVTVTSGRSNFKVAVLPPEDFPTMASGTMPHTFDVGAAELRTMIDKVSMAISTEETRYYLNGIYLSIAGDNLRAVATDGHRLVRHDIPAPAGTDGLKGVIFPRKASAELRKMLNGHDGDVTVSVSDTKIRFAFGGVDMLSKLIDGSFPPYERVIPVDNKNIMSMATSDITEIVDRCAAVLRGSIAIKLEMSQGRTNFTASSPEVGTVNEDADAEWSGPDMHIGFNYKYLGALVDGIAGDKTVFAMSDSASPVTITDPLDPDTLYVLMPLRV